MALYALGDPHLSFRANKSMEVFGGSWNGYVDKLRAGFSAVTEEDVTVLCGDLSWGMSLEEAEEDFAFLHRELPGRKIILKGNHDYWWNTAAKMKRFFAEKGFDSFEILHNNCCTYGGEYALCGTRGWFYEEDKGGHNEKVFLREVIRLETSLKAAGDRKKLCFLHYPPLYQGYRCPEILELLECYGVEQCFYGHLHGGSHRLAIEGRQGGVEYHLVSADYVRFQPRKIFD